MLTGDGWGQGAHGGERGAVSPSLSLRTAAKPRGRGPTAVRYLYDVLQRSSAVRCRACAAIPTDKALGHTCLNIAPLRSLLRDARSAARVIANTRRASQYSTACVNSTDPSCDAQVVCGLPATVLQSILRPVHRVQSGRLHAWKKQRWPQTTSGSVRDLSTRWRPHLSRARVWASSSAFRDRQ